MKFLEKVGDITQSEGFKTFLAGSISGAILLSASVVVPETIERIIDGRNNYYPKSPQKYEKKLEERDLSSIWSGKNIKTPYNLLEAYLEELGRERFQGIAISGLNSSYQLDLSLPRTYNAFYYREDMEKEDIIHLIDEFGGDRYTIYSNDFRVEVEEDKIEVEGHSNSEEDLGIEEAVQDFSFPAANFLKAMEIPYEVKGDEIEVKGEPRDNLDSEEFHDIVNSLPSNSILKSSQKSDRVEYSVFFGEEGFGYQLTSYKLDREKFEEYVKESDDLIFHKGLRGDFEPDNYLPRFLIPSREYEV